jgi:Arc/MetJ-type ribon-helix-helix transcriptional regulator
METDEKTDWITIKIPRFYYEAIEDYLRTHREYVSKNEVVRAALRDFFKKQESRTGQR